MCEKTQIGPILAGILTRAERGIADNLSVSNVVFFASHGYCRHWTAISSSVLTLSSLNNLLYIWEKKLCISRENFSLLQRQSSPTA